MNKRREALLKARKIVGLVQGTMALEGQKMDEVTIHRMVNQTAKELVNSDDLWVPIDRSEPTMQQLVDHWT